MGDSVKDLAKIRLRNLYFHMMIAHVEMKDVHDREKDKWVSPDERLMRTVESEAKIEEFECVEFRKNAYRLLSKGRIDLLGDAFDYAFDQLIGWEDSTVNAWFSQYAWFLPIPRLKLPDVVASSLMGENSC